MAPLDTGSISNLHVLEPLGRPSGPTAAGASTLGAYLTAAREHKRETLTAVADRTRIRIAHLKAIETDDFDALPSRPFAVGYVRAFARALDLDAEAAVERFRREHPDRDTPLQAPVGMTKEADDRRPVILAAAGALLVAVVLWNVAQRILHTEEAPRPGLASAVFAAQPVEPAGPIKIAPPTPAPTEQSTPPPYITPGMADAHGAEDSSAALRTAAANAAGQAGGAATRPKIIDGLLTPTGAPRALETRGAVYGEPAGRSPVLILARTSGSLVVRGTDGAIHFARVLQPGEAYRVPFGRGLTADMSDPAAFDLYVGGQLRGALAGLQTPLDKVAAPFVGAPAPPPVAALAPKPASPAPKP